MKGVSIIVPAYNAEQTLSQCLHSATSLRWPGETEVIVVNDGSSDRTAEIAASFPGVKLMNVTNGGAARATNIGIREARHDIVVSLDADAVLAEDWLEKIMPLFDDLRIAAAAGYSVTGNRSAIGKLMGWDVELRLDRLKKYSDHLYTMNTAYRRQVLLDIGMFDEKMKIAYDGDISRRLKAAGYVLVINKDAKCTHFWRDDLKGYLKQQYHYAYYRLDITRKFGKSSDQVAGLGMMLNVPFTAVVLLLGTFGCFLSPFVALTLLLLPLIHLPETFVLLIKRREANVFLLPLLFTMRNMTWTWAALVWGMRRFAVSPSQTARVL